MNIYKYNSEMSLLPFLSIQDEFSSFFHASVCENNGRKTKLNTWNPFLASDIQKHAIPRNFELGIKFSQRHSPFSSPTSCSLRLPPQYLCKSWRGKLRKWSTNSPFVCMAVGVIPDLCHWLSDITYFNPLTDSLFSTLGSEGPKFPKNCIRFTK